MRLFKKGEVKYAVLMPERKPQVKSSIHHCAITYCHYHCFLSVSLKEFNLISILEPEPESSATRRSPLTSTSISVGIARASGVHWSAIMNIGASC